jgi:uncharacterized peroxidase-related enzyme
MAFIATISEAAATGAVAEMYAKDKQNMGYLPHYTELFSHRPEVMAAWGALLGAIRGHMDLRRYELITLAAARALCSSYCMLAHASVLKKHNIFTEAELADIAANPDSAVLTPAELAMMQYAEQVVCDATQTTQSDIDNLKSHGFSDAEIFDITTAAAVRCFFSKTLDALGATADEVYLTLDEELQQALVVGRPITEI